MYSATVKLPFPGMEMAITINYDGIKPQATTDTPKVITRKAENSKSIPVIFRGDKILASRFERADKNGKYVHFRVPDLIGSFVDVSVNLPNKSVICFFESFPNRSIDTAQHAIDGKRLVTDSMGYHVNGTVKVQYPISKWGDYPLFYSDELMIVCNRVCKCMHKAGLI